MRHTQFLVFEISPRCNLAERHAGRCPVSLADRYGTLDTSRPLTDELIIECCEKAYHQLGFQGRIAWHYYNEPMLSWDRLRTLIPRIKARVHEATFLLWTNGTIWPANLMDLAVFRDIVVTDYDAQDFKALVQALPGTRIVALHPGLDDRALCRSQYAEERCQRMFTELIIDHYGNGHLCCMDFRGACPLGNVWDAGFEQVVLNFLEIRDLVSRYPMSAAAPRVCWFCTHRMAQKAYWVHLD